MCLFLNHLDHRCIVYSYDASDISFTWCLFFWFSRRLGDVHLSIVQCNRVLTAQRYEDWNTIKPHQMGFHSITGWVMSFQQHSYSDTQADPWTNAGRFSSSGDVSLTRSPRIINDYFSWCVKVQMEYESRLDTTLFQYPIRHQSSLWQKFY